eukprot:6210464-Pleurochrysis_carterae.AAC.2
MQVQGHVHERVHVYARVNVRARAATSEGEEHAHATIKHRHLRHHDRKFARAQAGAEFRAKVRPWDWGSEYDRGCSTIGRSLNHLQRRSGRPRAGGRKEGEAKA